MDKLVKPIEKNIFTVRGVQVMLDSDLAKLYEVKAIRLREQVKRNIERFPENFCFQLSEEETKLMVSQNAIPSRQHLGGHLPYVFTEQGVSMLSAVLRSSTAIQVSIKIIDAFVAMRKFIASNAQIFQKFDRVELKLLEHDNKFEKVFDAIEKKNIIPSKGIFFDGQIFDAYNFVSNIIREAKKRIILIDNFIDDTVLTLLLKRQKNVEVLIYTKNLSRNLILDIEKFNSQYQSITVKKFDYSHDRFMIIDDKKVYHFGASLKDLGKKWFAFSKFDKEAFELLDRLERIQK